MSLFFSKGDKSKEMGLLALLRAIKERNKSLISIQWYWKNFKKKLVPSKVRILGAPILFSPTICILCTIVQCAKNCYILDFIAGIVKNETEFSKNLGLG